MAEFEETNGSLSQDDDDISIFVDIPTIAPNEEFTMQDCIDTFTQKILQNCTSSQVESSFICYVCAEIEPVGWKAIWKKPITRFLKKGYDFLVYVDDVSQNELTADVQVRGVFAPREDISEDVKDFIRQKYHTVLLRELFVIHELRDEDKFSKTAKAIANVRFFYSYIWRPWDDEDDDEYVYVDRHLKPRVKWHYDSAAGVIPLHTVETTRRLLEEAKEVHAELEQLQEDMNASDVDLDLKEEDVVKCFLLNEKLNEKRRELQLVENPLLNYLIDQETTLRKSCARGKRPNGETLFHIVSEKYIVADIQHYLKEVPSEATLAFHNLFSNALNECYEGDTILLFPGCHICDDLNWIDDSITIKGLGESSDDTIVKAVGTGDIFINCAADNVHLENLKFVSMPSMVCAIMIHRGHTTIDTCDIMYGHIGVCLVSGVKADVVNCHIHESFITGIDARVGSRLHLMKSKIFGCGLSAISLEVTDFETSDMLTAVIEENRIALNKNYGLLLNTVGGNLSTRDDLQFESADTHMFKKFTRHTIHVAKNLFEKNDLGNIVIVNNKNGESNEKNDDSVFVDSNEDSNVESAMLNGRDRNRTYSLPNIEICPLSM